MRECNLQPIQFSLPQPRTLRDATNWEGRAETIKSKKGKVYYGYEFNTFTFRSLGWVYKMFYKKGKKVIPLNIYEYLTPLALAV